MRARAKTKPASRLGRKPVVYLVDDEELLLDLGELALDPRTFDIRRFNDPEAALRSFLRARVKPSLLVTDYAMGSMTGLELIQQCKEACPELRTVLVSGTAEAEVVLNDPAAIDGFISKPYQPESLSDLAHDLLNASRRT